MLFWIIPICAGTGLGINSSLEVAVRYPSISAAGALCGLGAGPFCRAWRYPARNEASAEWKRNLASPGCVVWLVTVTAVVGMALMVFGRVLVGLGVVGVSVGVAMLEHVGASVGWWVAGVIMLEPVGAGGG